MKKQLSATLENSREFTLAIAAAMPAEGYSFKPADPVWNFGELMTHIAYGIGWWEDNYIKGTETTWDPPVAPGGKKDIISYLEKSYAALKNTIGGMKLTDKEVQGFHATIDHITHHRGQATTYLRCKGITPPEYRY